MQTGVQSKVLTQHVQVLQLNPQQHACDNTHTCTHTYTKHIYQRHTHIHTYMDTHKHTDTHTHIYTHTNTPDKDQSQEPECLKCFYKHHCSSKGTTNTANLYVYVVGHKFCDSGFARCTLAWP